MRKLLSWIVYLTALALAGIAVLWVLQADKIEKNAVARIAEFNSGPVKLSYDALEVTGFPARMNIHLLNPKLSGRMDLLIDPNKQKNWPEWQETAALQGSVQLGVDIFSSHAELSMTGTWKNTSVIGGQTLSMASASEVTSHCALNMARSADWMSSLWDFEALVKHGPQLAADFRLFDCASSNSQFIDAQTNAVVFKSGPQRFYISSEPQGENRKIRVYLKAADGVVTPEGDRLIAQYYRALKFNDIPPMLSAYGTQNAEIDLTYAGPITPPKDVKHFPFELQLNRFNITNDAYVHNTVFAITQAIVAQQQSARLNFKSETTYNQIYTALVHENIRGLIQKAFTEPDIQKFLSSTLKNKYTPESLYDVIAPAIPDFNKLGTFTLAADIAMQGELNTTAVELTLTNLQLSVTPYGISGSGGLKRPAGAMLPVSNVVLRCRNCLQLANDLLQYANRIHDIAIAIADNDKFPYFDDKTQQGYKNFLEALAENDGAGNFSYTIVSDGKMAVTINKKRMDEILMLYHKFVPQKPGPTLPPISE